jgi:hypothetical protein
MLRKSLIDRRKGNSRVSIGKVKRVDKPRNFISKLAQIKPLKVLTKVSIRYLLAGLVLLFLIPLLLFAKWKIDSATKIS